MSKEPRKLPVGIMGRIKTLIGELEGGESDMKSRADSGTIELTVSEDEALWYVSYKTVAE